MSKVKLLVCYHKPSYLLKDEVFTPIHVGRALAKKRMDHNSDNFKWLMDNLIGDDTGENISDKNGSYNEMTSLYWAWKNYDKIGDPEFVGLMHYRRHLICRAGEIEVVHFDDIGENYFEEINYSPEKMEDLVSGCDFVTHIGRVNNVYKHYLENHRQEDLDLAFEIMYEMYPEYKDIAKEYFAGDYSNFCNMFIFKKDIFFEYCEWIFSILEEFENRVDTSEKRFFISERLTGVYIAKMMKDETLKHKVVPISFVSENVIVPIVIPYSKENEYKIATTISSLLYNKRESSSYTIHLLHNKEVDDKDKFRFFEEQYSNTKIEWKYIDMEEEYYPLVLAELFPKFGKCIYLTENVLVLKDIVEFYRTCSTDDFYVVGAPENSYDIFDANKKVQNNLLVLNLGRLRQHKLFEEAQSGIEAGEDGNTLFNKLCSYTIGYVPWYFETVCSLENADESLFIKGRTRGQMQADAVWKPFMIYDCCKPWDDLQGTYSLFWWEMAAKVPVTFGFCKYNENILVANFSQQQKVMNEVGTYGGSYPVVENEWNAPQEEWNAPQEEWNAPQEEWKNYSMLGKLRFYYKHNGLKNTVDYCWNKYVRKGEN